MSEGKIIVGLDIGTTKIACIVGKKTDNEKVEILGYSKSKSTGVSKGMVTNIEDTVKSIKEAVDQASEQSGVQINVVNVGIAGHHIASMPHRGVSLRDDPDKEITLEELEDLRQETYKIKLEPGRKIVDVIAQEYYVDGELSAKPQGMLGNKLEVNYHVVTANVSAAKNILTCLERANIELDDMILEPIASANAVLDDDEKELGVALVDIGGGTTDIAVFYQNMIRATASIPIGGNLITEDIAKGCCILKRYAEDLKMKFGSAVILEDDKNKLVSIPSGQKGSAPKEISFYNLSCIISARMEEIFDYVNKYIRDVNSHHQLVAGIVLTGGGANLKNIQQLASFMTGMDVRIGTPNENLANSTEDEMKNTAYATGVGLVIEGMNREKQREGIRSGDSVDIAEPTVTSSEPAQKGPNLLKRVLDRLAGFFGDNSFKENDDIE